MKNLGRKWSSDVRQIDLDVNRTYRDHEFFRLRYDTRQQQLFHVLGTEDFDLICSVLTILNVFSNFSCVMCINLLVC